MRLKTLVPQQLVRGGKREAGASIQKGGQVLFNKKAMELMSLEKGLAIEVAVDEDEGQLTHLYFIKPGKATVNSVKLASAGRSKYLNLRPFLSDLNIDYKNYRYKLTYVNNESTPKNVFGFELQRGERRDKKP